MGSVIKKRRKRMSKKKHRKLLRKTQQEVNRLLSPRPPYGEAGFLRSCGFAGWVLCRVFVFVERMCGSPVWGGARYLRDWDYD